ncbi:hypothetical protein BABINDRAFT_163739 [Babjeviella inositovora NRRL Y-12698]|uniref:Glutaredoxin domain-containing protein n=1 Tax=Babjeviella inositovora NRRL Y-12698 TaxID=984486 RepID=A0A1E3QI10_9ASCO|nr:uncharacterized protein BABINDRAFT_163739 [Babjeviella inositovora NRRL Y-12698]ODQ77238.1 hypothetical protein BABINDRAFT_163739 [Babjeviella inositovora NRRL Y-12698]
MLNANQRKLRLIGLSTFIICLIVLLVRNQYGDSSKSLSKSTGKTTTGGKEAGLGKTTNPKISNSGKIGGADDLPPSIGSPGKKSGKGDYEAVIKQHHDSSQKHPNKNEVLKSEEESGGKDLTTEQGSVFDPAKEFNGILALSPVVIFSKSYCGYSTKLKKLLKAQYDITPEPTIVELNQHDHGIELQNYIKEKSGRRTVPNMFVGGTSRGGCDEIVALHEKGELLEKLRTWGEKHVKVEKNPGH